MVLFRPDTRGAGTRRIVLSHEPWLIHNEIADRIAVAWFRLAPVTVHPRAQALDDEIAAREAELRKLYPDPASTIELLAPARALYRTLGLDPSRHRPASEALLRRIVQGKGLYRVNTAVDAANLASLTLFLPVGLYDANRIETPPREAPSGETAVREVTLRLGRAGEAYSGIGKEEIHLEDRPTLVDRAGPFGNPSSDSDRTKVTTETTSLLFVLFAHASLPPSELEAKREFARALLDRHLRSCG